MASCLLRLTWLCVAQTVDFSAIYVEVINRGRSRERFIGVVLGGINPLAFMLYSCTLWDEVNVLHPVAHMVSVF